MTDNDDDNKRRQGDGPARLHRDFYHEKNFRINLGGWWLAVFCRWWEWWGCHVTVR